MAVPFEILLLVVIYSKLFSALMVSANAFLFNCLLILCMKQVISHIGLVLTEGWFGGGGG